MVRISLSFLFVATAISVASAAPYSGQDPMGSPRPGKCLPDANTKEYQPFLLFSAGLNSIVSMKADSSSIVGGIDGDKSLQQLQFCLVTTDDECTTAVDTDCIHESLDYQFRVYGPVKGYLRVVGSFLRIVENFKDASGFQLEVADDQVVRVVHRTSEGYLYDVSASKPGRPIVLEIPKQVEVNHMFEFVNPNEEIEKNVQSIEPNHCVPETSIREYHPFLLKSSNLDTFVSKMRVDNIIVGGIPGNKNFEELELCIASSEYGCNAEIRSNCIYQNVDYRFRVNSPVQGYLRVVGNKVDIVKDFKDASSLNLYKEAGWGLRIAHLKKDGSRIVFSATKEGEPITLEAVASNAERQWFELTESN
ncbi:hypothetical protein BGZ82_007977 [Podila clonocystis]|nr:hypothetical protein BGZ82_007977 [Podila clonocystis]